MDPVVDLKDPFDRPEVDGQLQRVTLGFKLFAAALDKTYIGASKPVNRLGRITDCVVVPAGHHLDQITLEWIDILELVDKDTFKT